MWGAIRADISTIAAAPLVRPSVDGRLLAIRNIAGSRGSRSPLRAGSTGSFVARARSGRRGTIAATSPRPPTSATRSSISSRTSGGMAPAFTVSAQRTAFRPRRRSTGGSMRSTRRRASGTPSHGVHRRARGCSAVGRSAEVASSPRVRRRRSRRTCASLRRRSPTRPRSPGDAPRSASRADGPLSGTASRSGSRRARGAQDRGPRDVEANAYRMRDVHERVVECRRAARASAASGRGPSRSDAGDVRDRRHELDRDVTGPRDRLVRCHDEDAVRGMARGDPAIRQEQLEPDRSQ